MKKVFILLTVLFVLSGCSSSRDDQVSRKRRSGDKETTTTSKKDSNSTTRPTVNPSDTKAINEKAILSAAQIKNEWTQEKLCSLVVSQNIGTVLKMETIPSPKYSYVEEIGANCTWQKGNGDSADVEISTQSFKNARDIDASLNANGNAIVVSGVAGVIKTNGLGTFIELNVWGENSNQWSVNAPSDSQAKQLAEYLISSLIK